MHTLLINAAALRYVLPHVSSEESRPMLTGVLVKETGTIAATNGKTLATHLNAATVDPGYGRSAGSVVLSFHKPKSVIARNVHTVSVALEDGSDTATVTLLNDKGQPVGVTLATVRDARDFPNIDNLLAGVGERVTEGGKPLPRIALDPELLSLFSVTPSKYDNPHPVELIFSDARSSVLVLWQRNPDALGLIMPCQPTKEEELTIWRDTAEAITGTPAGV